MDRSEAKWELLREAGRLRAALARLLPAYEARDSHVQRIHFRRLALDRSLTYGLVEIDVHHLPGQVTIALLTHKDTIRRLSEAVGKPIKVLNDNGLTYCIVMHPKGGTLEGPEKGAARSHSPNGDPDAVNTGQLCQTH